MKAATVESCVEPATSASAEHDDDHRRLGERGEHRLAARAQAAETRADVETGEREEEPRRAEQRDDGDEVRGPTEQQPGREGRDQRRRDPGRGEDEIGRDAEQPGRAFGDHRLLARQTDEVAIGLEQRRARRRSSRAFALRTSPVSSGARPMTSSICRSWKTRLTARSIMAMPPAREEARRARAKTTLRYCRMVRNCSRLSRRRDRRPRRRSAA